MKGMSLGLKEALHLTLKCITPLSAEAVSLVDSVDRVAFTDIHALVDSPSMDSSRKDGYAVISHEVGDASPEKPVRLRLIGSMAAGGENTIEIRPGTTVRVLTGARVPAGADGIVSEEFAKEIDEHVLFANHPNSKNILPRGGDVALGQCIVRQGHCISPIMAGLLAAAGYGVVNVFRNPVVGIIGIGDEIVSPGEPLRDGNIFASNIVTLTGWCQKYKMKTRMAIVGDDLDILLGVLEKISNETDTVITSGGAWNGDKDLVARALNKLGWKEVFHQIRIGPGKAVGFGTLKNKPVFILAGGPPSNLVGFLQIALPGLLAFSGHANQGLPALKARLASELTESEPDWTDFFFGTLEYGDGLPIFHPMSKRSRLAGIAEATGIASIPEGYNHIPQGTTIDIQLLR